MRQRFSTKPSSASCDGRCHPQFHHHRLDPGAGSRSSGTRPLRHRH
jgi:hypothetical protein